jgi:3-hydroxymyristoyl/3-hydroxydecanoyl-(acyl carrier protein) dehydratase
VDPAEWFFKAHFFQDPVCPGSLGVEALIQLIKFMVRSRWPQLAVTHRFAHIVQNAHEWTYRGQILPQNTRVTVEATVRSVSDRPFPEIIADGYLQVDGLYIYRMQNFGIRLVPLNKKSSQRA